MSPTTPIVLDRSSDEPLYRQIEVQLRSAIRDGRVRPGTLLPGVRTLAAALGVARITVATAYDQLSAEGYVDGRVGSGTRVVVDPPGFSAWVPSADRSAAAPRSLTPARTGTTAALPTMPPSGRSYRTYGGVIDLQPDAASIDDFPFAVWERLLRETVRELASSGPAAVDVGAAAMAAAGEPGGDPVLREVLASRLGASRGLRCDPSQVIVTTGDWAALSTIADAWPGPSAPALVEDPGPSWIRALLGARGRRVVPVPVDGRGLRTDRLPASLGAPVGLDILVHVTPAWGAVLGGTLPPERRRELLARLGRAVRIVEDDRDAELRLEGPPPRALAGEDPLDRVIHYRGLERDLHPGARLGYLVVPSADVERMAAFVSPQGRGPGIIEQRTLARFIESGQFDRHLRRLRRRLQVGQSSILEALDRYAAGRLVAAPVSAGRHLVVRVTDPEVDPSRLVDRVGALGVRVGPVVGDAILLGFGGAEADRLAEGVRRMSRGLDTRPVGHVHDGRPSSSGWRERPGSAGLAVGGRGGERRHQP